tara:strand:+ start:219 stop:755 length:537 start_codon:yes stop_codon:yes gene_type:complete
MANGTLKVGTLTTSSGSGNITIGSGVTLQSNAPAFFATMSANQTGLTDNTFVLIQFNQTSVNEGSGFNTSTYKFVCPSGRAGKYYFFATVRVGATTNDALRRVFIRMFKNTSTQIAQASSDFGGIADGNSYDKPISAIADLSEGDTVEIQALGDVSTSTWTAIGGDKDSYFGAYRIGA